MKKELVKYSPLKAGYQKAKVNVKNIAKRIPGEYKFLGKVGKQLGKAGKFAVKNPISAAAIGVGAYALGASSRRYKKAPKFGEGRNLNTELIRRGV
jgi:hypothetical protein